MRMMIVSLLIRLNFHKSISKLGINLMSLLLVCYYLMLVSEFAIKTTCKYKDHCFYLLTSLFLASCDWEENKLNHFANRAIILKKIKRKKGSLFLSMCKQTRICYKKCFAVKFDAFNFYVLLSSLLFWMSYYFTNVGLTFLGHPWL